MLASSCIKQHLRTFVWEMEDLLRIINTSEKEIYSGLLNINSKEKNKALS